MIRQEFKVEHYWQVVVFYNLDFDLFYKIAEELEDIGFSWESIAEIFWLMLEGYVKAVTCSNTDEHCSIVVFNPHESKADYINSIVHEAEHVKQAMLYAYMVEDEGEPPAYTIGYLVMRMYEVFKDFL